MGKKLRGHYPPAQTKRKPVGPRYVRGIVREKAPGRPETHEKPSRNISLTQFFLLSFKMNFEKNTKNQKLLHVLEETGSAVSRLSLAEAKTVSAGGERKVDKKLATDLEH